MEPPWAPRGGKYLGPLSVNHVNYYHKEESYFSETCRVLFLQLNQPFAQTPGKGLKVFVIIRVLHQIVMVQITKKLRTLARTWVQISQAFIQEKSRIFTWVS